MECPEVFVGIDVSMDWLDVAVLQIGDESRMAYERKRFTRLVEKMVDLQPNPIGPSARFRLRPAGFAVTSRSLGMAKKYHHPQ